MPSKNDILNSRECGCFFVLITFIADFSSELSLGGRCGDKISRHLRLSLGAPHSERAPLVTQAVPTVNEILIYFWKPAPSVSVEVLNVANCATTFEP